MFKFKKLARSFAPLAVAAMAALIPLAINEALAAGPNLIANPGFETASGSSPANWATGGWGSNKASFTYLNTGHTGARSASVTVTNYSTGDAKWYFTPVTVTPSTSYTFSDWYESAVSTHIDMAVTNTSNGTDYYSEATVPASATWKQETFSFTTPANAKQVTFFHSLISNGTLTTDDYSLTANTVAPAPTVSISSPTANSTVSGTQTVTATATDSVGVKNVQFKLDGANLGAAVTTAPYSVAWDTTTATNASHTLTAVVTNTASVTATSSPVTVTVNNVTTPIAPTVSLTAPLANATVSGSQTVSATATGGSSTVKNVQFKLDGVNLGAADTTAPYSVAWDTTTATNATHSLTAVVTTASNVTATSTPVSVTVNNPTPPIVSISTPATNATVTGTQAITANASDAQGITSVQFKLDGANLGSPVTTAPYTYNWDSTTATNATHSLTAVATNKANLSTTSAPVTVTVSNSSSNPSGPVLGANLMLNPSAETSSGGVPSNWSEDGWGTNKPTYAYLNTGHTGGHSLEVSMSGYTTTSTGDADWAPDAVPVTPGGTYQFSDWYQSNTNTELDVAVNLSDGTTEYDYIQTVLPSSGWSQIRDEWDAPSNAVSVTFFHLIQSNGNLITDDYALQSYVPSPFTRGIVSVTIDDGYENGYTNALPILQNNNVSATFYIITAEQTDVDDMPNYMTNAQLKILQSDGQELASHTETHPDLTTVSATQLTQELQGSQADLQTQLGVPVNDLAYPDGAYNATVAAAAAKYYTLIRGIEPGFNTKDNTNFLDIKAESVDDYTTPAQVEAWVNEAIAQKTWLVLIYHEVANTPVYSDDALYTTTISDFNTEMSYIHSSGIAAESVQQAANEISPQL